MGQDARARFVEVRGEWRAIEGAWSSYAESVERERVEALVAAALGKRDKRRTKGYGRLGAVEQDERRMGAYAVLGAEAADAITAPYRQQIEDGYARYTEVRDAYKSAIREAGRAAEPRTGAPRLYSTTYASSYSTQGYGASRYARTSAELDVTALAALGVAAEVRRVVSERTSPRAQWETYEPGERYEVWAALDSEDDVEICKCRPLSVRDVVKGCWSRGENPRVYMPFLPYGYEASVGLDYQGRDVDAAKASL